MSDNVVRSDLEVALSVVSRDVEEWAERVMRLRESLEEAERRHEVYKIYRDDLRERMARPPAPPGRLDQKLVEELRGKNVRRALLHIAEQSRDRTVDTASARELLMAAGVVTDDATNASKHISVTLSRSEEFEMLERGKHRLTNEYIEWMNDHQDRMNAEQERIVTTEGTHPHSEVPA